jgi:hypothetical protein
MPATIGITSLTTLAAPPGCVINEATVEISRPVKTYKSAAGITVGAILAPMTETKYSISGKGIPALSLVAATASFTSGTAVVTSLSVDESNDDFPSFKQEAIAYS